MHYNLLLKNCLGSSDLQLVLIIWYLINMLSYVIVLVIISTIIIIILKCVLLCVCTFFYCFFCFCFVCFFVVGLMYLYVCACECIRKMEILLLLKRF